MPALVLFGALSTVLLLLAGCGPGGSDNAKPSDPAKPAGAKPQPGVASGRVTDADGKPIKVDGAQIVVHVSGVTRTGGEKVTYAAKPDADGNYTVKLADGRYQASAGLQVPFGGETFGFDLVQTGPKPQNEDQDSNDGPVFNFEWRLSGSKPGMPQKKDNPRNWLGASVDIRYRHLMDAARMPVFPPKGTTFTFTLSPKGKLASGAEGKAMDFKCNYEDVLDDVSPTALVDIPLGEYELSGKQIEPGGNEKALEFSPSTDQKTYSKTAAVTFKPAGIAAEPTGMLYIAQPAAK